MKIFLSPTGLCAGSYAMQRIAAALKSSAPDGVIVVDDAKHADVQLLYQIGLDAPPEDKEYVVLQLCGYTMRSDECLQALWRDARLVWSYYQLRDALPSNVPFLHAPLGIDAAFRMNAGSSFGRSLDLMTSGYTTGDTAEAIEEAAHAVERVGGQMLHIGPPAIENMTAYPSVWRSQKGMNDATLAMLYRSAKRVSGLRHVEGFELPALEGLLCGARPVVFDREDMRQWYTGVAEFVPESSGEELTALLTQLLSKPPDPVTAAQRAYALDTFSWARITSQFWSALLSTRKTQVSVPVGDKKRILVIGDAVASTGFARSTHKICDVLRERHEVHVLGLNYFGDPHDYPYKIYPAVSGGDIAGLGRVAGLVDSIAPAAVVIQNDPWNFQPYLKRIGNVPTIGFVAVDGKNVKGSELAGLTRAVFWTEFGRDECVKGGWTGKSEIVPLGVDTELYLPQDRGLVRAKMQMDRVFASRNLPADTFVVGSVGRNQERKRLDLTIEYFAQWVKDYDVKDAALWLHVAPTNEDAFDLEGLAEYYGVLDRVMLPTVPNFSGKSEEFMARTYAMIDVLLTTTMGEGFWLPGFEAMSCGTPVIAPDWSAIGELFKDAALLVPCSTTLAHPRYINSTIGGIADKQQTIAALDWTYRNRAFSQGFAKRGQERANEARFNWRTIGEQFADIVDDVIDPWRRTIAVQNDGNVGDGQQAESHPVEVS